MQDNRPAVYLEGDTVVYRASALGHCLRSLWAARNAMDAKPFPKAIQDAMDEGTELESHILNLLYEEHHWGFARDGQQFQVELVVGAWNGKTLIVRGKMDERRDDGYPVDVKAVSESFFTHPIPDYYLWQQSVYAIGLGKDRYYMPIYNKDTEKLWDPSLVALVPKYNREQIRDRVLQVEEAFYENKMPDCTNEYGCPYYYLHEQKPTDVLPEPAVLLVRARIKLSEKIKTLEAARKKLDEAISPKLDQDVTYYLDGYSVVMFLNPARFNTDAAKRLLTEAEVDWKNDPDFWIEGKGTQLRMTPKKGGD